MQEQRYYRTNRTEDGKWQLLDPNGNPFFSLGVNCVYFPDNLAIEKVHEYGTDRQWFQRFTDKKLEQISSYGFNTLAAWHETCYWEQPFPKTVELSLSKHANKVNRDWGIGFPDVFCESFLFSIHRVLCDHFYGEGKRLLEDSSLIGYFTDNELHWWGQGGRWGIDKPSEKADPTNLVNDYIALPAHAAGKQRWVEHLQERYADIEQLNQAWDSEYCEFDDLLQASAYTAFTDAFEQDKLDFLRKIGEMYFRTTTTLLKQYDPHHLILGCRMVGASTPLVIFETMQPYVDVVSLNFYTRHFPAEWIQRVSELADKPVMIGEFSICAGRDAGFLSTTNGARFATVRDQRRRSELYDAFIKNAVQSPACIGAHWFALYDYGKDRHGLIGNYGLLTVDDEPWEEFTLSVTKTHQDIQA